MNRNIELIRYRHYGDDLLLLDLVNSTTVPAAPALPVEGTNTRTVTEYLAKADQDLTDRYEALKAWLLALGDDVQFKVVQNYFAFRRIKNFACVEVHPRTRNLLVYVKVDPDTIELKQGFTRDVRNIGHFGTGELEITLNSMDDLEKAKPLIEKSYEAS
jgi:predicted transport protein